MWVSFVVMQSWLNWSSCCYHPTIATVHFELFLLKLIFRIYFFRFFWLFSRMVPPVDYLYYRIGSMLRIGMALQACTCATMWGDSLRTVTNFVTGIVAEFLTDCSNDRATSPNCTFRIYEKVLFFMNFLERSIRPCCQTNNARIRTTGKD